MLYLKVCFYLKICIAACILFIILLPRCYGIHISAAECSPRVDILYLQVKLYCHLHLLHQVSVPDRTLRDYNWILTCLSPSFSPMPVTLLHTLSRSDSTQIPSHKYMCADPSVIMNYFCSPYGDSKIACRWRSVEEAAVRPLGPKRVWSRDINWKWETCLACHQSISVLAVDMFSLFLVSYFQSTLSVVCCTLKHQTPGNSCITSNPVWLFSKPISRFSTSPFIPKQLLVLHLGGGPSHSIELLLESCGLSDCLGKQMKASLPPKGCFCTDVDDKCLHIWSPLLF